MSLEKMAREIEDRRVKDVLLQDLYEHVNTCLMDSNRSGGAKPTMDDVKGEALRFVVEQHRWELTDSYSHDELVEYMLDQWKEGVKPFGEEDMRDWLFERLEDFALESDVIYGDHNWFDVLTLQPWYVEFEDWHRSQVYDHFNFRPPMEDDAP